MQQVQVHIITHSYYTLYILMVIFAYPVDYLIINHGYVTTAEFYHGNFAINTKYMDHKPFTKRSASPLAGFPVSVNGTLWICL